DGVDDRVLFTNPYTGGGDHTISAWVFQRTATGCDTIVTLGSPTGNKSRWLHSHYGAAISAGFYGNDWNVGTNPLPSIDNAGWVLLHWTFKGGSRQSRIYRDGAPIGQPYTFSGGIDTVGPDGNIGFAPAGWGTCWLNGILDEVRLSTTERTAGWIATEFANQNSPQTFYTVGAEEPVR
ncbi:MAG TPA: LamG-like jellyroll fold domain-containing protein, partial [Kofleriaceae bacterium]|nr:LamG-like jellyroll fold domain-containing protein [Kofleriaceae bacterium]